MMDWTLRLDARLQELERQGLRRQRRVVQGACGPQLQVDGKPLLAFCSNDYLGLAAHPAVVEALREGAALYGAGSGASALISGHSRAHALLEERLAEFLAPHLEAPRALHFCSGYMANLSVLTALAAAGGPDGTEFFSEELNHASLIDGMRLACNSVKSPANNTVKNPANTAANHPAKNEANDSARIKISVFPHRDVAALEAMLAASPAGNKIVVTDSLFSMDGNLAPLPELLALCGRHGAVLVVDDAHGFGVLGENGRGALEHFGLRSRSLVLMGTLGKAAGVAGAFVAAHASVVEWLVQRARPYIYTTAAPPALAHALLASLDLIGGAEGRARRAHLLALAAQWRQGLALTRWHRMDSSTPVQPVIIGSNEDALAAAASLRQQGFWVPAIRPPTVPAGTARLRVTLSAAHTAQQVATLVDAVNALDGFGVSQEKERESNG